MEEKKRGRPPLPEEERKSAFLMLWVTPEFKDKFVQKVEKSTYSNRSEVMYDLLKDYVYGEE